MENIELIYTIRYRFHSFPSGTFYRSLHYHRAILPKLIIEYSLLHTNFQNIYWYANISKYFLYIGANFLFFTDEFCAQNRTFWMNIYYSMNKTNRIYKRNQVNISFFFKIRKKCFIRESAQKRMVFFRGKQYFPEKWLKTLHTKI